MQAGRAYAKAVNTVLPYFTGVRTSFRTCFLIKERPKRKLHDVNALATSFGYFWNAFSIQGENPMSLWPYSRKHNFFPKIAFFLFFFLFCTSLQRAVNCLLFCAIIFFSKVLNSRWRWGKKVLDWALYNVII